LDVNLGLRDSSHHPNSERRTIITIILLFGIFLSSVGTRSCGVFKFFVREPFKTSFQEHVDARACHRTYDSSTLTTSICDEVKRRQTHSGRRDNRTITATLVLRKRCSKQREFITERCSENTRSYARLTTIGLRDIILYICRRISVRIGKLPSRTVNWCRKRRKKKYIHTYV